MNYDYRPIRQNYTAHSLVMLLFLFSGISFGLSGFFPTVSVPCQVIGIVLLLPAIQLIARYMATRYLYRLHTYEDGRTDLEIFSYRGGDKMQMVCCVGLSEITGAAPLSRENQRAKKDVRRYSYAQDLCPQSATLLSVLNGDGVCEVLFCPDEYIIRVITDALAGKAKGSP